MTSYSHLINVPVPVEIYDATHAELLHRTAGCVTGLIVHLCRPTDAGFQIHEVSARGTNHGKSTPVEV